MTSERLSNFIESTLEALAALIEVSIFQDIGKHSEEILNYLRIIITAEPVYCLRNVQQVNFFFFVSPDSILISKLFCESMFSCLRRFLEPI